MRRITMFIILLIILSFPVSAKWTGSQTITIEYNNEFITSYTSILNYEVKDDIHITLVFDKYNDVDIDLSTTVYTPFKGFLYATTGIRYKVNRETVVPYISFTIGF